MAKVEKLTNGGLWEAVHKDRGIWDAVYEIVKCGRIELEAARCAPRDSEWFRAMDAHTNALDELEELLFPPKNTKHVVMKRKPSMRVRRG